MWDLIITVRWGVQEQQGESGVAHAVKACFPLGTETTTASENRPGGTGTVILINAKIGPGVYDVNSVILKYALIN